MSSLIVVEIVEMVEGTKTGSCELGHADQHPLLMALVVSHIVRVVDIDDLPQGSEHESESDVAIVLLVAERRKNQRVHNDGVDGKHEVDPEIKVSERIEDGCSLEEDIGRIGEQQRYSRVPESPFPICLKWILIVHIM